MVLEECAGPDARRVPPMSCSGLTPTHSLPTVGRKWVGVSKSYRIFSVALA